MCASQVIKIAEARLDDIRLRASEEKSYLPRSISILKSTFVEVALPSVGLSCAASRSVRDAPCQSKHKDSSAHTHV